MSEWVDNLKSLIKRLLSEWVKNKVNKILDSYAFFAVGGVTFYKANVTKVFCCKNPITSLVFRLEFKHLKELPW